MRQIAACVATVVLVMLADPRPVTFAIGSVIAAMACLLRIWSFGHLIKNKDVVTTGPYAYSRNPAYVGSFFALAGVALAAGNAETVPGRVVWGVFLVQSLVFFGFYMPRKLSIEYPRLERLFGDQLREYAANVPDFWPRLSPWRSGNERRFSFAQVSANCEWPWAPALAIALTAIWYVESWSPLHDIFQ